MTLTQKILAAHARNLPRPWVQAGDVLQVSVDWTIASELAWNGMERTYSMLGRPKLHDKDRFFLAVDHTVDPVTLANDKRAQKLVQLSRTFAKESGIRHFYDANQTILHTRFYRDLVRPGDLVLGADSHTSSRLRLIETNRSPTGVSLPDSSEPWSTSSGVRRRASSAATPVIFSAAWFHNTTRPSRSTATMPSAMFARIAKLRSFSSATRW